MRSRLFRLLLAAAAATVVATVTSTAPASALSFSVVGEASGVGGPQTAGTLLRLNIGPFQGLVAGPAQYAEPWSTAPADGLRVRTTKCDGQGDPRDLPIKEVRVPGLTGGTDVVVFYPGSTDTGYGTCSYRGLVNLVLTPAAGYGGGNRSQVVVIRS